MTLANKLTLARLALAGVTFGCLWSGRPSAYVAGLVFYLLAMITDWVDGYVARRTGSVSPFGVMADPIADKVLIIGALIACVRIPELDIPHWAVFLIIVRELIIGGLRALAGSLRGTVLPADRGGKWKMGVQSVAVLIILLLLVARKTFHPDSMAVLDGVENPLVVLSMIVSLLSGVQYVYAQRSMLRCSWNAPKGGAA